eukprot:1143374-Pelagomonas_calceolata.AAC.1
MFLVLATKPLLSAHFEVHAELCRGKMMGQGVQILKREMHKREAGWQEKAKCKLIMVLWDNHNTDR